VSTLLENARALAQGETCFIDRMNLLRMCRAFGGREWVGNFTSSATDFGRGTHERVVALCMAHQILRRPR
jgi:hypothetical protein